MTFIQNKEAASEETASLFPGMTDLMKNNLLPGYSTISIILNGTLIIDS